MLTLTINTNFSSFRLTRLNPKSTSHGDYSAAKKFADNQNRKRNGAHISTRIRDKDDNPDRRRLQSKQDRKTSMDEDINISAQQQNIEQIRRHRSTMFLLRNEQNVQNASSSQRALLGAKAEPITNQVPLKQQLDAFFTMPEERVWLFVKLLFFPRQKFELNVSEENNNRMYYGLYIINEQGVGQYLAQTTYILLTLTPLTISRAIGTGHGRHLPHPRLIL